VSLRLTLPVPGYASPPCAAHCRVIRLLWDSRVLDMAESRHAEQLRKACAAVVENRTLERTVPGSSCKARAAPAHDRVENPL